jgi:hypothetical protein
MALVAPDCGHARLGQRETPAQTKAVSQEKYRLAVRCAGPGRVDALSRTRSRSGLKELVVMSVRKHYSENTEPMDNWCVIKLGRRVL